MKKGWKFEKLREVCQIRPSKREVKERLSENDLVSFVPMKALGIEQKYFYSSETKELSSVSSSYTYFQDGDVLLAKITPCFENGKLGIAKELTNGVGFGSSEYIVYRPHEIINNEFLYYFLNQEEFREIGKTQMQGAVGHKRITKDFYEDSLIPVPPISIQKQIVEILDQAFEAIDQAKANIEKNIVNAKELFQSKLNEIFVDSFTNSGKLKTGWVEKKLKEITTKIGSGATPRGGQAAYKESGISLIRSMNVHDEGFRERKLAFIDDEQAAKLNNVTIEENDVLLNITGASVARCCIVENNFLPARVNQHVSIIRLEEGIMNNRFLHYALTSNATKNLLLGIGSQGATRQAITKVQIENFKIQFPSDIKLQNKIVDSLDLIREKALSIELKYNQKLTSLEELKKSILQKAFSGELTNPN